MTRSLCLRSLLVLLLILSSLTILQAQNPQRTAGYGKLPLAFEPNVGQTAPSGRYLARGAGYSILITDDGVRLALPSAPPIALGLVNATQPHATAERLLEGKSNYLLGKDPAKWHTGVPQYERVRLAGIYRGVDLLYYGNQRQLEYDFVVAPGTDAGQIALHISGGNARVDQSGDLIISAGGRELRMLKPIAYQQELETQSSQRGRERAERIRVAASYVVRGKEVAFELGDYDRTRPLVIDPVLSYATYFGGTHADQIFDNAVDGSGNQYIAGYTESTDLPTTTGALDTTCGSDSNCNGSGGADAFVSKLNATGTALVWSTYLGGNSLDQATGIAVDGSGNSYVTGFTVSTDFPGTALATGGSAFVTKLNASGSGIVYSALFGGQNGDGTGPTSIAIDGSGNAYVTGNTSNSDFPVTLGAFQPIFGGGQGIEGEGDAFVSKLNASGTALVYSTYAGGSGIDSGAAIGVDSSGNAYVAGNNWFGHFPTTAGVVTPNEPGEQSAIVFKLNAAGSALVWSTYLGSPGQSNATGLALDADHNVYVVGLTETGFPTTTGARQTAFGGGQFDDYVVKLNPTATARVYSTYIGGNSDEGLPHAGINSARELFVAGSTNSTNFPVTANAAQKTFAGSNVDNVGDAYALKLSATGGSLVYSTYLGGNSDDAATSVAVDGSGNMYVAGNTTSSNFLVTAGALQTTNHGNDEGWAAKINFSAATTCAAPTTDRTVKICAPANGSTVDTPVHISAAAADSNPVTSMQVYVDGVRKYVVPNTKGIDTYLPMTSGSHRVTVQAVDAAGTFKSSVTITVTSASACVAPNNGQLTFVVCKPQDNGTYSSPVEVEAAASSPSGIKLMRVKVDGINGVTKFETTSNHFDTFIQMDPGTRNVWVEAFDNNGSSTGGATFITVSGGSSGCPAPSTARTVNICSPANGSTVASPVRVTAAAKAGSSAIKVMQVYVDGVKKFEQANVTSIDTSLAMANGAHRVTVQAVDASGAFKSTVNMNVGPTTENCSTNGTARTVTICQPLPNATVGSPVHVSAAAHPGSTTTTVLQLYVDGVKKQEANAAGLGHTDSGDIVWQTDQAMGAGSHRVTVQAIDSAGAYKSTVTITVQ
jgi:hypothetical protein